MSNLTDTATVATESPRRPKPEPAPCAECGGRVDRLRTRYLVLTSDGFRFFCTPVCREAFRETGLNADGDAAQSSGRLLERPSPKGTVAQGDLTGPFALDTSIVPAMHDVASDEPRAEPISWLFVAGVFAAVVLGALAARWPAASWVSGALTLLALAHFCSEQLPGIPGARRIPLAAGPLGVALVVLAGMVANTSDDPSAFWLFISAALCTGALAARVRMDQTTMQPIAAAVAQHGNNLPRHARVGSADTDHAPELSVRQVPLDAVRSGMEILVVAGERIPVDGVVQRGEALVLPGSRTMTPIQKRAGDAVLAGSLLTDGALRILGARVGPDRALNHPATALHGQTAIPFLRAGRMAVPVVVATASTAALATAVGLNPLLTTGAPSSALATLGAILLGLPVLALGQATRRVAATALSAGLERGFIFASSNALDLAGRSTTVALPARGAITEGKPALLAIHTVESDDENALLAMAAAAESAGGTHPIAKAVRELAESRNIAPVPLRRSNHVAGKGVTATTLAGENVVIGNRGFLLDAGVSVALAEAEAIRAEARGHTVVFLAVDGHVRAFFALQDATRPGARGAVQRLFDMGLEVILCSADHRGTVETLAKTLDVTNVRADLAREDRGRELRLLHDTGGVIATIGRPGRDDAALAAADIPVLLQSAGAPQREDSVALASDDIRDAAAALFVAHAARRTMVRVQALITGATVLSVALAASALWYPVVACLVAWGIEAVSFSAPDRLQRRLDLRVPTRG